jgi:hypothetical protein
LLIVCIKDTVAPLMMKPETQRVLVASAVYVESLLASV